ncbi:hypothetical protein BCV69DRAFT_106782 [Microstroma glucosiphilum]|uniref:Uncharacterized protein n=1 Tax=Pseudomicrostroma glucosiphilum TaxID=1684307 RepID=A0A316UD26_9BASI|nr:hypothetical protein BCV69DRAFT_106782 [Pseudomicrostroma glucosiphilum]PWN23062.1 hypothetical protein BCV69DRAFT_106782 [Pseudomicrostroma glucosiphilum]
MYRRLRDKRSARTRGPGGSSMISVLIRVLCHPSDRLHSRLEKLFGGEAPRAALVHRKSLTARQAKALNICRQVYRRQRDKLAPAAAGQTQAPKNVMSNKLEAEQCASTLASLLQRRGARTTCRHCEEWQAEDSDSSPNPGKTCLAEEEAIGALEEGLPPALVTSIEISSALSRGDEAVIRLEPGLQTDKLFSCMQLYGLLSSGNPSDDGTSPVRSRRIALVGENEEIHQVLVYLLPHLSMIAELVFIEMAYGELQVCSCYKDGDIALFPMPPTAIRDRRSLQSSLSEDTLLSFCPSSALSGNPNKHYPGRNYHWRYSRMGNGDPGSCLTTNIHAITKKMKETMAPYAGSVDEESPFKAPDKVLKLSALCASILRKKQLWQQSTFPLAQGPPGLNHHSYSDDDSADETLEEEEDADASSSDEKEIPQPTVNSQGYTSQLPPHLVDLISQTYTCVSCRSVAVDKDDDSLFGASAAVPVPSSTGTSHIPTTDSPPRKVCAAPPLEEAWRVPERGAPYRETEMPKDTTRWGQAPWNAMCCRVGGVGPWLSSPSADESRKEKAKADAPQSQSQSQSKSPLQRWVPPSWETMAEWRFCAPCLASHLGIWPSLSPGGPRPVPRPNPQRLYPACQCLLCQGSSRGPPAA